MSLHRPFIGGSDVSAIAGINPYKRPINVWRRLTGRQLEEETTLPQRIGAARRANADDALRGEDGGEAEARLDHPPPQVPSARWEPGPLNEARPKSVELKTGNIFTADRWGEEGTDEVPEEYLCQVAWYQCYWGTTRRT